jgi:hypothetical protein
VPASSHKKLQAHKRYVAYHDVSASRDIIVAVGRFYELFRKHECNVGVIDVILVSMAKYLMDFHFVRDGCHGAKRCKALGKGIFSRRRKVSE